MDIISSGMPRALRGLGLALLLALPACDDDDQPRRAEYAVWSASPQSYDELAPFPGAMPPVPVEVRDQTLRQIAHLSAGGDALRIELSNLFGSEPLTIAAAGIAVSSGADAIDANGSLPITFAGQTGLTLAPGAAVVSDYAALSVAPETDVAVSLYIAGAAPLSTVHTLGLQSSFVAPGNRVSDPALPGAEIRQSYSWLTRIDARSTQHPQVIVAFGDSITDGYASTPNENRRYPNELSRRLLEQLGPGQASLVNAGISGNRVLNDVVGPAGVSRFARDVLGTTGASHVIVLLGINDVGFSGFLPEQSVSADEIIDGLARIVATANANGVRPFLGTLLPLQGTAAPYYNEAAELKRQLVNEWIRGDNGAAGVIDFDRALQDPAHPLALPAEYDSGDHLHPNDAGYAAMADAVDAELFR
ncbi:MAG TPA: SGNH/GDSL hydrolase family protein [Polyangiaceae bacterium]|nr:SGNH/GDSL hydrolase family protein [Polyangiaceae bacterium]